MPDQRYRALKQCRKFMEELCDPGKTPRVPSAVRDKARDLLKHYPMDSELGNIAEACPEYLDNNTPTAKIRILK